ncbi:GNAT family N-acetyltransferase [Clostridium botulinum]|nr:GNAT family N-acetyltransferase [Clostridium botulinum]NFP29043.1 GNAT family N-acetyltransferase [Clostridium botulinum]
MNISKGQKQDISDIFDIISNCIKHMESQGIYQWNKFYPSADIIENDIESEHCYVLNDNGKCIAYVAINEEQYPEYSQIKWFSDGRKVLVIHRLSVHPESQGKGIAKKVLNFIEDMATKNNYSCIRLDAYSGNETALKLYEHFGYKKAGQVYFPWRDLPFYCYEKNI